MIHISSEGRYSVFEHVRVICKQRNTAGSVYEVNVNVNVNVDVDMDVDVDMGVDEDGDAERRNGLDSTGLHYTALDSTALQWTGLVEETTLARNTEQRRPTRRYSVPRIQSSQHWID